QQLHQRDLEIGHRRRDPLQVVGCASTRRERAGDLFCQPPPGLHGILHPTWDTNSSRSSLGPIRGFARSIEQDMDAVMNALTLPWSNGPVEGHINKLKLLKRQMYGRAGIELLRRRLLAMG